MRSYLGIPNPRQGAALTARLIKQHFHKEKTVDEVIAIERKLAELIGDNPHPLKAHLQRFHDVGFRVVDYLLSPLLTSSPIDGSTLPSPYFVLLRLIDDPRRRGDPQERNDATEGFSVQ